MSNNVPTKVLDDILNIFKKNKNIYLVSHINPDGDNIGSLLALGLSLLELNKNVYIIKSDIIPSDYEFLPGIKLIQEYEERNNLDLLIILDCSDIDRLGNNKELASKAKYIVNIDHHISNTYFGDINFVDDKAAATGELIYYLIEKMGVKINEDIATNLYTAISTDTGSFKYESVTDKTHKIIAELYKYGIDHVNINNQLYHNISLDRTNLLFKSFDTLKMYKDNKLAIVKVTQDMLKATNTKLEDTEGIISFVKDINSVEVACLLKEFSHKEIKVSIRSKSYVDVAKICEIFGGGGHKRAAGCTISENIETAEKIISNEIIKVLGD